MKLSQAFKAWSSFEARLGVLIVHPRQVRRNPYVRDLDRHSRVDRVWDFKRVRRAIARKVQQVKAI